MLIQHVWFWVLAAVFICAHLSLLSVTPYTHTHTHTHHYHYTPVLYTPTNTPPPRFTDYMPPPPLRSYGVDVPGWSSNRVLSDGSRYNVR